MTAQRYVHDILQPHVFPLVQWLPGAIFQQDNACPQTARVSQDCLHTVTTLPGLPDPQICLQSSISGIIWDGELGKVTANMEQNVSRYHTELVCLNVQSYRICVRGGSTGY
ncbi:transposable element Tcb2 transposase [Trichonephila clavipes]|nr:transposable element Tcb2 transposase [Trichonephila clavipes]